MIEPFLAQVSLFAGLSARELGEVARLMRVHEYGPGLLFHEDQPGDQFRIVYEGEVEVVKAVGTAEERLLALLGAGQFFGEVALLVDDGRRSASIRADSTVKLLELGRGEFESLLHRHPSLGLAILRAIVARLRQTDDHLIHDLQQKNRELARAYEALREAQAEQLERQKLEVELQTARRIQERFLPEALPNIPTWDVAAYWQPALAVSGDFYDFVSLPGGMLGVVAGDVTSKGVPAALVMATTQSMLRMAAEVWQRPGAILKHVNNLLVEQLEPMMFVTCCFCVLDPQSGDLTYANAGHPPPYRQTTQSAVELRATGMPLGLMPGVNYEEKQARLGLRDNLVLYSDGLLEAHNGDGEMFGFERVRSALQKHLDCKELIAELIARLTSFTGQAENQDDDVTLVALQKRF